MSVHIKNIHDLKGEISRLTQLKKEQEAYLSEQYRLLRYKIEAPSRVLGILTDQIPGVSSIKGIIEAIPAFKKQNTNADWLTRGLQLGLPLVLNKTLLKNAGWFKKSLVLLASETAARRVNKDNVENAISKVANFIRPKKKKKHNPIPPIEQDAADTINFGIPPESETS